MLTSGLAKGSQCNALTMCVCKHRGPEWAASPTIYLPENVNEDKASKLRRKGAKLVLQGKDAVEAEREARRLSEEEGLVYISPYNDEKVSLVPALNVINQPNLCEMLSSEDGCALSEDNTSAALTHVLYANGIGC